MAAHEAAATTHQFIMSRFLRSSSGEVNNDIVVEMKTDKANEEANLLNKRTPAGQVRLFTRVTVQIRLKSLTAPRRRRRTT